MKCQLQDFGLVTPEKAEFIEKQANDLFDFVLESRRLLTAEAHTTMNWLFAIIVSGSGYSVTLSAAKDSPTNLLVGLLLLVACSGGLAVWLFHGALQARPLYPKGNSPSNLMTDDIMGQDMHMIRLSEAMSLQDRITEAMAYNRQAGACINRARWGLVLITAAAAMTALVTS